MKCPICGAGEADKMERRNYLARYKGEPVEVPNVELFHCNNCGEEFLSPEQAGTLSVAVKNEVRRMFGLLPPERIVSIREMADLTQEELEHLLGQGPKVVVRWESGRVIQSKAADTLLRLLENDPGLVKRLREVEKSRSEQRQKYSRIHAVSAAR